MAILQKNILLRSGIEIPQIGFGTYQMKGSPCESAVQYALSVGYRHIDSAIFYQNERIIGKVIKEYDRQKLFITSKIPPNLQGYDTAYDAVLTSLQNLDTDYIDLVLIHWPGVAGNRPNDPKNAETRLNTWRALEQLKKENKIRSIGVSNFLVSHLRKLMDHAEIMPDINQVEYHPLCQNASLLQFCKENHIQIEAYSPLARRHDQLWQNRDVIRIAREKNATIAQILLKWGINKGLVVLPKSVTRERIFENIQLDHFELNENDMESLNNLNQDLHTCWNPESIL